MPDIEPMSLLEAVKSFQEQVKRSEQEPKTVSEDETPSVIGLAYCYGLDDSIGEEPDTDEEPDTVEIVPLINSIIAQQLIELDMNFRPLSVREILDLHHMKKEF